jgi:hypothetical protein
MSSIPSGRANSYMAAHWNNAQHYINWDNSGWQGNTLVQAQPLNTGAQMVCG